MARKQTPQSTKQPHQSTKSSKSSFGTGKILLSVTVVFIAIVAYFTGFFDYGIEDYEKFHHERVMNFYGNILTDYHEYHGGYLTFGLWKNLTSGERITKFEDAAENLYYELAVRANLTKNSDLLDVACGMASQDVYLYKKFGANITAVDLLDKHINIGRKKLEKNGLTNKINLVHASGTNLPFANNSFTHVLNAEGGPHMHTREQFFRETMRVLKPGGVFAFSETTITKKNSGFLIPLVSRMTGYLWRCSPDNIYDNDEYIERLQKIGFTDINLIGVNLDVYPDYQISSWEAREELYVVRGKLVTWAGAFIDVLLRLLSEYEYIDYVLVTGKKPMS